MPSALLSVSHVNSKTMLTVTTVISPILGMRKSRLRSKSVSQLTQIKTDELIYDKNG